MPSKFRGYIVGHAGKDLQINPNRTAANFSVAANWGEKKDGQWVNNSEWVRVTVFGKAIDSVEKNFSKGALVHAEGDLRTKKYTGKDGIEKSQLEMVFANVMFLDKKEAVKEEGAPPAAALSNEFDQQIPF